MAGKASQTALTRSLEAVGHDGHRALSDTKRHLKRRALELVLYVVVAYVILRLIPTLKQALQSLEHVSWEWVLGAIAIEVVSESGFVLSWRAIIDPDNMLQKDGRGTRTADRVAWAQLGGGLVVPGGSYGGIGVGGLILHRFGMPTKLIARRQFSLSFLNTAVSAIAIIVSGVGLATGIFSEEENLLLTLLPAAIAAAGLWRRSRCGRLATRPAARQAPQDRRLDHDARAGRPGHKADPVSPRWSEERPGGGHLSRTRGGRSLDRVSRSSRSPRPGVRRRRDGVRDRRSCRITSAARLDRDGRAASREC
jgi:hypothetical protein